MQTSDRPVKQFGMAGYSGTPLAQKLGIKPAQTIVVIDEPADYRKLLGTAADRMTFARHPGNGAPFVHFFTTRRAELEKRLKKLRTQVSDSGVVWVSWPKKSAGLPTDVTENVIRDVALPLGFVDVKVCAVDEMWSGLKLMIRRKHRQLK